MDRWRKTGGGGGGKEAVNSFTSGKKIIEILWRRSFAERVVIAYRRVAYHSFIIPAGQNSE